MRFRFQESDYHGRGLDNAWSRRYEGKVVGCSKVRQGSRKAADAYVTVWKRPEVAGEGPLGVGTLLRVLEVVYETEVYDDTALARRRSDAKMNATRTFLLRDKIG